MRFPEAGQLRGAARVEVCQLFVPAAHLGIGGKLRQSAAVPFPLAVVAVMLVTHFIAPGFYTSGSH